MDSWIRNQEEVFGRGLNLGQQREQERIIKLLENDMCSCTLADCQVAQAIALIKGEK